MTQLYCDSPASNRLTLCETRPSAIGARLAELGVRYEHIDVPSVPVDPDAQTDEIIHDYLEPLNAVEKIVPYESLAVMSIQPTHPRLGALQRELMTEHAHGSAEAQLLVKGGGVLFMRTEQTVFALVCEPGDFVCLPPRLCHWFEMDCQQGVCTIRLFEAGADLTPIQRGRDMRHVYSFADSVATEHAH